MSMFICNAFNDPNDPWYYVIGVLFLLLVFGALALYLYLSKKKAKNNKTTERSSTPADGDGTENADVSSPETEKATDGSVDKTENTEKTE